MTKKNKPILLNLEIPEVKDKNPKLERKETETIQIEKPEIKGKGKVKKNKQ